MAVREDSIEMKNMGQVRLKSITKLSGEEVSTSNDQQTDYTIYWNNLTYKVYRAETDKLIGRVKGESPVPPDTRIILNSICGSFSSRQMTALMGPSGAGKTTLLECLIGKRRIGLSGNIQVQRRCSNASISHQSSSASSISLAIVPQMSDFFEYLTLSETLKYASHLKNSSKKDIDHESIARSLVRKLDLELVTNSPVKNLSGSERKRLSVGTEIVSRPNLLVLDEPTTGLDSFSAQKLINLLHSISREGVGVIMTIHQPSWNILKMFDKVYMLSPLVRRCVYEGTPDGLIPYLATKGLTPGVGITPPDFITDVASGHAQGSTTDLLSSMAQDQRENFSSQLFDSKDLTLNQSLHAGSHDHLATFQTIFVRSFKIMNRDFSMFWCQFLTCILMPLLLFFQLGGYLDYYGGCPPSMEDIPERMSPSKYFKLMKSIDYEMKKMAYNKKLFMVFKFVTSFIGVYIPLFGTKYELSVVWKEVKNNYYSPTVYYIAKTTCDLCMLTLLSLAFACIAYPLLGGNMNDVWRPFLFILGTVVQINFCHALALIVGCIFWNAPLSVAIFVGEFLTVPHQLATGFFLDLDRSLDVASAINYISITKYCLDLEMLSYFGYDACGDDIRDRVIAIRRSITSWIYESFSLIDSTGSSIFGNIGDLAKNSSLYNSIETLKDASNYIGKGATKYFISRDGEVRSAGLAYQSSIIDSDLGRLMALGMIMLLCYRLFAYFSFIRASRATF